MTGKKGYVGVGACQPFQAHVTSGWLNEGMPLESTVSLFGNSSLSTTQIYARSNTATKREIMKKYRGERPPVGDTETFWRRNEDTIRKLYGLSD